MTATTILFDGPRDSPANSPRTGARQAPVDLVLAHGAGAPMDSPFMAHIAQGLGARGLRIARFEFPYMAARRADGRKRPPDRAPTLLASWRAVIAELGDPGRDPGRAIGAGRGLAIGGKSLGGRMASLVAAEDGARAVVCLGYPFHPPGRPEKLRTAHLEALGAPTLIVQGERDPFGRRDEVAGYALSPAVRIVWCPDGDHSLVPRKASGRTAEQNWDLAVEAVAEFLAAHPARRRAR
jgi:predicted alpha/beta-hydrolase family hydrolase